MRNSKYSLKVRVNGVVFSESTVYASGQHGPRNMACRETCPQSRQINSMNYNLSNAKRIPGSLNLVN